VQQRTTTTNNRKRGRIGNKMLNKINNSKVNKVTKTIEANLNTVIVFPNGIKVTCSAVSNSSSDMFGSTSTVIGSRIYIQENRESLKECGLSLSAGQVVEVRHNIQGLAERTQVDLRDPEKVKRNEDGTFTKTGEQSTHAIATEKERGCTDAQTMIRTRDNFTNTSGCGVIPETVVINHTKAGKQS
tara:strand:+ start:1695 stop:2252 length:558 start_codon:yes stop_codon:yes gene_type:complete